MLLMTKNIRWSTNIYFQTVDFNEICFDIKRVLIKFRTYSFSSSVPYLFDFFCNFFRFLYGCFYK